MFDLLIKGGFVMWPIAGLGLVSIAIIIERAIYFYITGVDYEFFRDELLKKIRSRTLSGTELYHEYEERGENEPFFVWLRRYISLHQWNRNCFISVASTYLDNLENGTRTREEALKRVGSEEIEKMEKHSRGLSAISQISPLLGLLGTVTGIISSFTVISQLGGQVDVTALAGGIWEAMLTTAAGLVVAIPAQLAFLYFEKIVAEKTNRMSYIITYLNEEIFKEGNVADAKIENIKDFSPAEIKRPICERTGETV